MRLFAYYGTVWFRIGAAVDMGKRRCQGQNKIVAKLLAAGMFQVRASSMIAELRGGPSRFLRSLLIQFL